MAQTNESGKTDAILEKILEEMKRLNRKNETMGKELKLVNKRLKSIDSDLRNLDSHVELMRLGYHDVRDRVSELERRVPTDSKS